MASNLDGYYLAYHRFQALRSALLDQLHEHQRAVLLDESRYIAAICGRRAGKTEMDARAIALALEECGPDEWVVYAARTRGLAKDLIWSRVKRIAEDFGLGWRMLDNEGYIQTPRGGQFRLFGFDKLPELEKIRGYKLRLAVFDEPATYAEMLERIITASVAPALGDLRGRLLINGTPGPVCLGFWHNISTGLLNSGLARGRDYSKRYSRHHWTALENPFFSDARSWFQEEMDENGYTEETPVFRQEYLGEWIDDPDSLVYAFVGKRNLREMPAWNKHSWLVTMGVDFGLRDESAWSILGSERHSRDTYVLHSEKVQGLIPEDAAEKTKELVMTWAPGRIVGDGAAAEWIETYNRRFGARSGNYMHNADKLGKRAHIAAFNGDLRKPRLFFVEGATDPYVKEIQQLPWKNPLVKDVEHPGYDNHCCDSGLYAHTDHRSYWHVPEEKAKDPVDESLDRDIARFQAQTHKETPFDL